jgi:hypothetical protein
MKFPDIRIHSSAFPPLFCFPPGRPAAARIIFLNCLPQRMEYQRENDFVVNRRMRHENN